MTVGYRYNERNELTERVKAGSLTTYRYDKNGSIISEEEEGRRSEYRYDLLNRQIYVKALDGREQESTAYITGQENAVENFYQYDAFGNLLEKHEDVGNRILYTGQQYDQETGKYYLRARDYNPVVGRILQEDTYRGDGLNLYAYCANNPVVYYDPSGYVKNNCPPGAAAKTNDTLADGVGNGRQYSTLYEAGVGSGATRGAHRNAANREFYNKMKNDSNFKASMDDFLGYDVMEHMKSGKGNLKNPSTDWVWHHPADKQGVIRLIPRIQHQSPALQDILHSGPSGKGGFGLFY